MGVDENASTKFKNSLIYKLAFHRAAELTNGVDRARGQKLGNPEFPLTHFTEVFTSENWIVRLYKVNKMENRIQFGEKKANKLKHILW